MMEKKLGVILGSIISMLVITMVVIFMISKPIVEQQIIMKMSEKRVPTLVLGDGDPGGASGFFYFMIYPHSADPANDYKVNLSNATAWEYSDVGNASCTGDTHFGAAFDIILKVGVTDDDGKNTTTNAWDDNYMWCTITCADLSIGANTNMSELEIYNNSGYRYMQYYMNNGGAGYTITEGQDFNITSVKFWVMRVV